MTIEPGGAPRMRPSWSPTVTGISHQPSPHERMPRSRHMRAYSRRLSSALAGMAAREWLIRYVQVARIGNCERYARRSSTAMSLTLLDWRRRVFALYADVRAEEDPERAWERWCEVR